MFSRGEVFVRAKKRDGSWGNVDVLDLAEDSFRAWVVGMLNRAGIVVALTMPEGPEVELRERGR